MSQLIDEYLKISSAYKGFLVLYRIGEFYETFFDDAVFASKHLNMHLTTRGKYNGKDVPLCGFPARSLDLVLNKLVFTGQRVVVTKEVDRDRVLAKDASCEKDSVGQFPVGVCDSAGHHPSAGDAVSFKADKPSKKGAIARVVDYIATPATFVADENYQLPYESPGLPFGLTKAAEMAVGQLGVSAMGFGLAGVIAIVVKTDRAGQVCVVSIDIQCEFCKVAYVPVDSLDVTLGSIAPKEVLWLSESGLIGFEEASAAWLGQDACKIIGAFCLDDGVLQNASASRFNPSKGGLASSRTEVLDAAPTPPDTNEPKTEADDVALPHILTGDPRYSYAVNVCRKFGGLPFTVPKSLDDFAQQQLAKLGGFGFTDAPLFVSAAIVGLLCYIKQVAPSLNVAIRKEPYFEHCLLNKGVLSILAPAGFFGPNSLYRHLDHCRTKMGKRFLAAQIRKPLADLAKINKRLAGVELLSKDHSFASFVSVMLANILDVNQLSFRILNGRYLGGEMALLHQSLKSCHALIEHLRKNQPFCLCLSNSELALSHEKSFRLLEVKDLLSICVKMGDAAPCRFSLDFELLVDATKIPSFGGKLLELAECKNKLESLEMKFRQAFGKKVSVFYRSGVGYAAEVSSKGGEFPSADFSIVEIKKSSVVFTNKELQDITLSTHLLKESLDALQKKALLDIVSQLDSYKQDLHEIADFVGEVDFFASLAAAASCYPEGVRRCVPSFSASGLDADDAFHPILLSCKRGVVSNSLRLYGDFGHCVVVHGANMSGKSTLLRQFVILQVMSQIGCLLPAKKYRTFVATKIMARVGSGDDVYNEKSTFFNEMEELAEIASLVDQRCFCVIDEIGRGTSAKEGFSVAAASLAFINKNGSPLLMFATHYHNLEDGLKFIGHDALAAVRFAHMESIKRGDELVFTNRLVMGSFSSFSSHALAVAKKAGVNKGILDVAQKLVDDKGVSVL